MSEKRNINYQANYNQTKELNRLLVSIFEQTKSYNGKFEVIIIADGEQIEVKEEFINKENVKYFQNKKNIGSGLTRHFGVSKSSYDLLFFIDSDTIIENNFLNLIDQNLRDEQKDGVIGIADSSAINNNSITANYLAAETNYYGNKCKTIDHRFFIGLCGEKNVYNENLGFYHRYIDDMEFSSRLGDKVKIKTERKLNLNIIIQI